MKKRAILLSLAGVTIAAISLPAAAAPRDTVTACPVGWGSLTQALSAQTTTPMVNVRTGRHDCYDRVVVDVPGAKRRSIGYSVRYVSRLVQDGSGQVIPVPGRVVLEIVIRAPAYDTGTGEPTYPAKPGHSLPGVNLAGYRSFRASRYGGSFEGQTQLGLGVRARLPFRVLALDGHLVVDVEHRWR
ncbi:hypothetical protein [Streptomyces sp. NPDC007205]|uniref:AMIN-like domain-containing (lipo)protein n=1 Tax=Streptomyces sp. NPDC007205 TaxID=3154316 RepID=UPI0033EA0D6B